MRGPHRLFVYGTLMDPSVRRAVLGERRDLEVVRAMLPDHRRFRVTGFDYPYVAPELGSIVEGMVLLGLADEDLVVLDDYEDVAEGLYERRMVTVRMLTCGSLANTQAWVYAQPRDRTLTQ
ncbi:MAG: gamma-glutamylcyclotransferase family protein [Chloroflexota bacterium]